MSGTGQPATGTKTIQYSNGASADTTTWAQAGTMANWIEIIGAGSTVVKDEAGNSQTYTTDANQPNRLVTGVFSAFTSTTAVRATMGSGPAPGQPPLPGTTQQAPVRTGAAGAVTNATATMANLADLSVVLAAGQKVTGLLTLFANNSTGAEGLKFDFNGGSATFTSIEFGFVGTPAGATVGTASSTAIGTAVTCTAVATTDACYTIAFSGVVNAGGTLIPRFAEVSHTSGTATVQINSSLSVSTTAN